MKYSSKKKSYKNFPKWFYFVLVLIPFVLLVLLELILNLVSYGNDYSTFVKISDGFSEYKFFNPKLPQKYFGNSPIIPSVIPDGFKKSKDENTFRIFALGGSTTAGFPFPPNGAFPRLLRNRLQKQYPQMSFEVINLGISAINTLTIRDIIDDVLNENPDLIVIYAGHNEYYGAMGAASNLNAFSNPTLKQFLLSLKKYRSVQLIENSIRYLFSLFTEKSNFKGTLMSEMAGKNLVPLNSKLYFEGIKQFESNLSVILSKCERANVKTLLGTLASNLLQEPLCKFSGCDSLISEFNLIKNDKRDSTKWKLYSIKERDALRFRAPEKINEIIRNLGKKYNCKIFDVKSLFEENSEYGIIGENLMMDQLHPNYYGNLLISKLLLSLIKSGNYFDNINPVGKDFILPTNNDVRSYSLLDSSLAELRIKYLKNNFPFVKKSIIKPIELSSFADTLSNHILNRKYSWENAHQLLAKRYLKLGDVKNYVNEMNVLIDDKPFDKFPLLNVIQTLEKVNNKSYLIFFLMKYYENFPNFNTAKKIANIFNKIGNLPAALKFYQICLKYSKPDPEIFFNLSALYYSKKDIPNALKYITKCVNTNPDYPNAMKIFNRLSRIYNK